MGLSRFSLAGPFCLPLEVLTIQLLEWGRSCKGTRPMVNLYEEWQRYRVAHVGKAVRTARRKSGQTQRQCAAATRVELRVISQVERAQGVKPATETELAALMRYAEGLGVLDAEPMSYSAWATGNVLLEARLSLAAG
jgi:hypothetical protein